MASKRKRGIATDPSKTTSRKRTKVTRRDSPPDHPHGNFDQDRDYKVRSIIEETKTHYRIDWEDDEVTGERYDPTWEPKSNANAQAISDWERQRASKGKARQSSAARPSSGFVAVDEAPPPKRSRGRPRRVILSSPGLEPSSSTRKERPVPTPPVAQQQLEIDESQDTGAGARHTESDPEETLFLREADFSPVRLPSQDLVRVQLSDPPSSYANYVAFDSSQVLTGTAPEKKASPEPSQYQPDPGDTSKTTEETTEVSAVQTTQDRESQPIQVDSQDQSVLIVPDSQSLPDSQSFRLSQLQKQSASSSENQAESQLLEELHSAEQISQAPALQETQASADESAQDLNNRDQVPEDNDSHPESQQQQGTKSQVQYPETLTASGGGPPDQDTTAADQPSNGAGTEPREGIRTDLFEVQVDRSSQPQAFSPPQDPVDETGVEEGLVPAESAHAAESIAPASSAHIQPQVDSASQPGVITVTSGITPSAEEFEFSSQVGYGSPYQQRQRSYLGSPREEAAASQSVDHSNDTSFPFETQLPPAQQLLVEAQAVSPLRRPQSQPVVGGDSALGNLPGFTPKAQSVPAQDTSPFQVSSQLPSVPSESLPFFGESAPPIPAILSSPSGTASSTASQAEVANMQTRFSGSGDSILAQLKEKRERREAERALRRGHTPATPSVHNTPVKPTAIPARVEKEIAAESPSRLASPEHWHDGARSPSAVPAMQPIHAATQEEMNTSERYGTLLPQEQDGATLRRQSTITGTTPKADATARNHVHAVPIAVMGLQRDTYQNEIVKQRGLIERFLASSQPDEETLSETEALLERLRHVLVHPDLVNPEAMTQYDVDPVTHADWAVACSAKFRFLKHLLGSLREHEVSVAIIAETGQLLQVLETFLTGLELSWERVDSGKSHEAVGNCPIDVKIIPSHEDVSTESMSAGIVVELEHDASLESSTMKLLQDKTGENTPLLMSLVVPNTVEHVERCLSHSLPRAHKLRSLVHAIFDLRFEAGKLEEGQLQVADAAKAIAEYANVESGIEWPVAALSVLENLDSQTESEIEPPPNEEIQNTGEKRVRAADDDTPLPDADPAKRARISLPIDTEPTDLPVTINPLDIEITRVSESVTKPSQLAFNDFNSSSNPSYLTETEKTLQSLLHTAQNRLAEHEQALSDLQYRHEDQRAQLIAVTNKHDAAILTAQRAEQTLADKSSILALTLAERSELRLALAAANSSLQSHSIPERGEFETLRQNLARTELEKAKLEKRLQVQQRDLAYAQEMYQASSSTAQNLASQTTELENQVSHYANRAAGEQARARQMTLDSHALALRRENKLLKARIAEMERTLGVQAEELQRLKEAGRGRMGTRGASVPRSPRMASPRKTAAGPGSRQGSPAPGDLRNRGLHPLRQQG